MKYILFLFLGFTITNCYSQISIPKAYSELKESPASGKKMTRVIFDMDNDSKNDIATIIKSNDDFSTFKLLIYLSSLNKQFEFNILHAEDFAIAPIPLTYYKNVLVVTYLEDRSQYARTFKLRLNTDKNSIQIIGFDTDYRTSTGNCIKSYNLLTGNYEVKNQYLNDTKSKEIFNTGIEKTSPLYIDDFNFEMLEKLDNVGKKYQVR